MNIYYNPENNEVELTANFDLPEQPGREYLVKAEVNEEDYDPSYAYTYVDGELVKGELRASPEEE